MCLGLRNNKLGGFRDDETNGLFEGCTPLCGRYDLGQGRHDFMT